MTRRSPEQKVAERRNKRQDLTRANRARKEHAELRRKLRAGEVDPWRLLRGDDPEWEATIAKWPLERLLRSVPRIGPARAHEVLFVFRASPQTQVRALTEARRAELARLARSAVEVVIDPKA